MPHVDARPPITATSPEQSLKGILPVNTSILAIVAGYLGLFSLLLVFAPFALLCGILAVVDLNRRPGRYGHVRAWFGIIMGLLGSLLLVFIAGNL
ncbi:MAG: DUF4190 domain-containing protein [Planctomycetes bacterium]|nr:DUF4190 domain-containing protein [Planctomycetota bacterium]